jgi:hypothetical protein
MNPNAVTISGTNIQAGINVFGLIGFAVSATSASLSMTAILTWRHLAAMDLDLEGGSAFSAYFVPNLIQLAGIGLGLVGLIIIATSVATGRKRKRYGVDFIHVLSGVLLAPAAYLLLGLFFW